MEEVEFLEYLRLRIWEMNTAKLNVTEHKNGEVMSKVLTRAQEIVSDRKQGI